jgi:3-hydroxyacyl-CoA dehydrogenase/enoyl-CoA hydratase/3-hydroxybutyryl-CoA epimerase
MIKAKQLGCKAGRGFFIHEVSEIGEQIGDVNPKALQLIESEISSPVNLSPEEIEAAITCPMVIEATKLLEIGRARSAGQLDLAVMCGFGFATSCGGPLHWADQVGADRIVKTLESLQHLGPHLRPTQSLLDAALRGLRFYDRNNDDRGDSTAESSSAVRNIP